MINLLIHGSNFLLMNHCSSAVEGAGTLKSHFHSLQANEHCSLIDDYSNILSEAPFWKAIIQLK